MTFHGLHHIVFRVGDLREAEPYYADLFGLDVLFREGSLDDEFGAVPDDLDWEAAIDAGVEPGMSFLGRETFALALVDEPGPGEGRLDHVALAVEPDDQDAIEERASGLGCETWRRGHSLFVEDRYGVEWELNASSPPPETPLDPLDV